MPNSKGIMGTWRVGIIITNRLTHIPTFTSTAAVTIRGMVGPRRKRSRIAGTTKLQATVTNHDGSNAADILVQFESVGFGTLAPANGLVLSGSTGATDEGIAFINFAAGSAPGAGIASAVERHTLFRDAYQMLGISKEQTFRKMGRSLEVMP